MYYIREINLFSVKSVKPVSVCFCLVFKILKTFVYKYKNTTKMGCNCRKKRRKNKVSTVEDPKETQNTTMESANNDETDKKSKLDMLKSIWEKSKEEN